MRTKPHKSQSDESLRRLQFNVDPGTLRQFSESNEIANDATMHHTFRRAIRTQHQLDLVAQRVAHQRGKRRSYLALVHPNGRIERVLPLSVGP